MVSISNYLDSWGTINVVGWVWYCSSSIFAKIRMLGVGARKFLGWTDCSETYPWYDSRAYLHHWHTFSSCYNIKFADICSHPEQFTSLLSILGMPHSWICQKGMIGRYFSFYIQAVLVACILVNRCTIFWSSQRLSLRRSLNRYLVGLVLLLGYICSAQWMSVMAKGV
jgi:hypothetical protein